MTDHNIENMLSQLIRMVGTLQVGQQEIKELQQQMQSKLDELEMKEEGRHTEVLERLKALEHNQDFVWEKTVRNEREIGNIKIQMNL